jgi:hypothetical protein
VKTSNSLKYRQAKALVSTGSSVIGACDRAGITVATYYSQKKKQESMPTQAASATAAAGAETEATLEEQIISSNLSPKAKVKVLTTLLNA